MPSDSSATTSVSVIRLSGISASILARFPVTLENGYGSQ
jgi:hypothetical protein